VFEFQQRLEVKLNTRAKRELLRITAFPIILSLNENPNIGV
jgi:hypothetical protein